MSETTTLKEQIAACILWSLPIPTLLIAITGGHAWMFPIFAYFLSLFIPIVVFCFMFGKGKGAEFKVMRIIIAAVLWGLFWLGFLLFSAGYISANPGWLMSSETVLMAFIFAGCNAIALAMVVKLSYETGKWINSKTNKKPSE